MLIFDLAVGGSMIRMNTGGVGGKGRFLGEQKQGDHGGRRVIKEIQREF